MKANVRGNYVKNKTRQFTRLMQKKRPLTWKGLVNLSVYFMCLFHYSVILSIILFLIFHKNTPRNKHKRNAYEAIPWYKYLNRKHAKKTLMWKTYKAPWVQIFSHNSHRRSFCTAKIVHQIALDNHIPWGSVQTACCPSSSQSTGHSLSGVEQWHEG